MTFRPAEPRRTAEGSCAEADGLCDTSVSHPVRPRIVVVQHEDVTDLAALRSPLSQGADLLEFQAFQDRRYPAHVDRLLQSSVYDGLIVLGGPMGVGDKDVFTYLTHSLRLVRDALQRNIPLLGLCLGSQMIAHELGMRVYPGTSRGLVPEVGLRPVALTEAGMVDALLRHYAGLRPVMMWHVDTHELPPDSVLLASTPLYQVQAFRAGNRAWGIQFHPEADGPTIVRWAQSDGGFLRENGIEPESLAREGMAAHEEIVQRAQRLAAGFLAEIRRSLDQPLA